MQSDLITYYGARAAEYEKLYENPERQHDLTRLTAIVQDIFRGKNVLEIACGTGWWTQRLALTAAAVSATDINDSMLGIARHKLYTRGNVRFLCDDIYQTTVEQSFEGVFGGFIWSHVPLDQLDAFLAQIRSWLQRGGTAVFIDNLFVPGSSTPICYPDERNPGASSEEPGNSAPISRSDTGGNTYQLRRLKDGSEHLVLKNFPDRAFLTEQLSALGGDVDYLAMKYYWLAAVRIR